MATKTDFASRALGMGSALANLADNLEILEKVYAARDYGTAITQADLDPLGITLPQFNQLLGVIVRFGSFINGLPVTETNNREIVNELRTDI